MRRPRRVIFSDGGADSFEAPVTTATFPVSFVLLPVQQHMNKEQLSNRVRLKT